MREIPGQIAFEEPCLASERTSACNDAIAELVYRYSQFAFKVAYAVLRNAHDAEDAVQETFLKIYRSGRLGHIKDERPYIARTAWRIAVDMAGKKKTKTAASESATGGASPEDRAISADSSHRIHRLIEGLPTDLRLPLALSTVEGLNSQEIAVIMGIPEGTVRRRLMRARQMLKTKLLALGESNAR